MVEEKEEKMSLRFIAKTGKKVSKRFVEIDIIRGLAIILMVFAHILWDLSYFKIMPLTSSHYNILARAIPFIFFVLVGISIIISFKKKPLTPELEKKYYKHLIIRGLKIIGCGMVLTFFSFLLLPDKPVYFGVLHCIGLSILLCIPFLKIKKYSLPLAIPTIASGVFINQINFQNPNILLFIIGFQPAHVQQYTVDYFPILPWFGFVLLGLAIGDVLYCGNKRRFRFPDLSVYKPARLFSWCGKHSLGIYLLHQPIIGGVMYLFAGSI